MAVAGERDLIFANFQAASGIENADECIAILEEHNWDFVASINAVVSDTENPFQNSSRVPLSDVLGPSVSTPPFVDLDPPVVNVESDEMTRDSILGHGREIKFVIVTAELTLHIPVLDTERVAALKRHIEMRTGIPQSKQQLVGWPQEVTDQTQISSLNLDDEVHLILEPDRTNITPLHQKPCNMISDGGFQTMSRGSGDSFLLERNGDLEANVVTLSVRHNSRDFTLPYPPSQTIRQVKADLFSLTGIPVRNQSWTGWPRNASDSTTLGDAHLSLPSHKLFLESKTTKESSTSLDTQAIDVDPGVPASFEDSDPEEHIISDDNDDDAMFGTGSLRNRQQSLIAPNGEDTSDVMVNFAQRFEERYGDCHPMFYMGPFVDAINEASGQNVKERKPLLIYLHHDGSIQTNIFCGQILCSETVAQYINQNFVIWGWDISHASNKKKLVNTVSQHFGSIAATTVQGYRDDQYPLLLLVMKRRSALEVYSVIEAGRGLDEIMTTLMQGNEEFNQTKKLEVKEEEEREAREMMKREQDQAYYESLAADRAKAEAEKLRQQAEADAKLSAEIEAQEKEARRMDMENQLPQEPTDSSTKAFTNILFRLPDGKRVQRKFFESDLLKVVFIFIESKGFNMKIHKALTHFPRRELTTSDSKKTLKDLNLCQNTTIYVEEI